MTIDTSEVTINVVYQWNPDLFTIIQKKAFCFFFYRDVTAFHEIPLTPSPCFSSRNITKNAETHPPPICGVIIEQTLGDAQWVIDGMTTICSVPSSASMRNGSKYL